jgi:hypothetical protein
MTHALKTLSDELAYLRFMHAEATSQGSILANSYAADIADCDAALEVLTAPNDCGTNTTQTLETALARDPIINTPSTASGSPKNASAGRIKSIGGGGANFSSSSQQKGSPPPNSPYGK